MKKTGIAILLILLSTLAFAQTYYADVELTLDDAGVAQITGRTNHPLLSQESSSEFSRKNNGLWLFNMTLDENFSNYVFKVTLPKDASINYVKSPGPIRIEGVGSKIMVAGYGQGRRLEILLQYAVPSKPEKSGGWSYLAIPIFALALCILYLKT
ncbi:MAG TPA: hypothetical protein ENN13_01755, partial [Candidatus Altiarchaeales archaeon]|nr:hypothetical protein [Candidatus Altiarchaeales archaeon]